MTEHVDKMQSDLDTLKDLLATSTYSLDNATILSVSNQSLELKSVELVPSLKWLVSLRDRCQFVSYCVLVLCG